MVKATLGIGINGHLSVSLNLELDLKYYLSHVCFISIMTYDTIEYFL